MNLEKKIAQLNQTLSELKEQYLTNEKPENKRDRDFFFFVREQTAPVYELIEEWYTEATQFVKQREVKVHPQQIESTKENFELILMHSYYIDVRRKRYMELNQSIQYVFDLLLDDIKKVKS